MSNQLVEIIKESGLTPAKADVILKNFQDYFTLAAEWEQKAKTILITNEAQLAEMKQARVGRLFLREKRLAIEKCRKELKEQSLREGKAIDGIANVLKALIIPIEEYLEKQESFIEIKAAEKAEQERLEAERKAEEERIQAEKLDSLHRERREILLPYADFWELELHTVHLGKLSNTEFFDILSSLEKEKEDNEKRQAAIAAELEKTKRDAEEQERIREAERQEQLKKDEENRRKQQAELNELQRIADEKRKELEAQAADLKKLEEQRKKEAEEAAAEKKRLEAELERKKAEAGVVTCPYCKKTFQTKKPTIRKV